MHMPCFVLHLFCLLSCVSQEFAARDRGFYSFSSLYRYGNNKVLIQSILFELSCVLCAQCSSWSTAVLHFLTATCDVIRCCSSSAQAFCMDIWMYSNSGCINKDSVILFRFSFTPYYHVGALSSGEDALLRASFVTKWGTLTEPAKWKVTETSLVQFRCSCGKKLKSHRYFRKTLCRTCCAAKSAALGHSQLTLAELNSLHKRGGFSQFFVRNRKWGSAKAYCGCAWEIPDEH